MDLADARHTDRAMAFDLKSLCVTYVELERTGEYPWSALHRMLRQICVGSPCHENENEVYAKIRIINRTYLANLQFGVEEAERKVAQEFIRGNTDSIVAALGRYTQLNRETLPAVLRVHEQLVMLAHRATGKAANSFVSKYLHFHFPDVVPIYDSKAYDLAWKLAPVPESEWIKYKGLVNVDYCCYCPSVVEILSELQTCGVKAPQLELLDFLLYGDP
jgi:hypothetical protein